MRLDDVADTEGVDVCSLEPVGECSGGLFADDFGEGVGVWRKNGLLGFRNGMQVERPTHRVHIVVFLQREHVIVPLTLPETHGIRRL